MAKKKKIKEKNGITSIDAICGYCMGTMTYRGFAPLSVLSQMSQPDEFHQLKNPNGTQRNLSPKHAKEAYQYAQKNKGNPYALWPEIILNIRNKSALKFQSKSKAKGPKDPNLSYGKIKIDWGKIEKAKGKNEVAISRVDGNHRLHFSGGERNKNFPALEDVYSPFCIIDNIPEEGEREIFKTINAEQKKLRVDHLLRIEQQQSSETILWKNNKPLWIVGKLSDEKDSPFYKLVHMGGKKFKEEAYLINQKGLLDGVRQIFKHFTYISDINSPNKLKPIMINYFKAVKAVWPTEWQDKKKYKLMTNTGLQALGILGGKVMNNLYLSKKYTVEKYKSYLRDIKNGIPDFWESKGDYMEGKSGRPGAQKIADDMYDYLALQIDEDDLEV